MKPKTASNSLVVTTQLVMPNDTNVLGNLMGGQLMYWMDITAGISAHRHCGRVVVTAAVNNVCFGKPVNLGDMVTLEAKVSRAFTTSMEVLIKVWRHDHRSGEKVKCNEAAFTFVAVDQLANPIEVSPLLPETAEEKKCFDEALRRRQLSLILAGRMKPNEATELAAMFGK